MSVGWPLRKDSISSLTHAPWKVMGKNGFALGPSAGAQWFQCWRFRITIIPRL